MDDIAPTRSRTDPPAPEQQRSQLGHIGRRLHANTIGQLAPNNPRQHRQHSHRHLHRDAAKETVQSAIELKPPVPFDHLLRRDKKGSEATSKEAANGQLDDSPMMQQSERQERKAGPGDVAKARRDNARREEELRSSLKHVEQIGMDSTRQLDDTYYAILEKASILRSTVSSLQQLADECKRMHTSFQEETTKLEQDTQQSLESFGNFDQQETTINALVSRLQDSRSKTDRLNDRLESARLRVEAYENRDNAKQAKRRAQWHTIWLSLFGVVVVLVAMLVAKHRERVTDVVETQLLRIGDLVEDVAAPGKGRLKASPTEDPYLQKLFDEL